MEFNSFYAFRAEYARVFGPKRRGMSFEFAKPSNVEDSPEYHANRLKSGQRYKALMKKKKS
jgi:hypothetical protein